MGAGATSGYETEEAAIADGKTQEEIDEWKQANPAPAAPADGGGNDIASGMVRARRNSILAVKTEKAVDAAADEEKAKVLLDTMTEDLAEPEGADFASWALSCCTELCTGAGDGNQGSANRNTFVSGQCCEMIVQYLSKYPLGDNPVHLLVQYQGFHAIGNLASDQAAADKFGSDAMLLIVAALGSTNSNEVASAGIRALSQLVAQSEACKTFNSEDLIGTLKGLMGDFSGDNMFQFKASELVVALGGEKPEMQTKEFSKGGDKKRKESLTEGTSGGEGLVARMGRARRNSILAAETEKAVDAAADEEKAKVLLDTMTGDLAEPEGPDFASWALSCCTELCAGNKQQLDMSKPDDTKGSTNRDTFVSGQCCEMIVQYLSKYPDDLLVQYQGFHAIGNLASDQAAADKFGSDAMLLIVKAMYGSTSNELASAGIRALTQLVANSEVCKTFNSEDLITAIKALMEDFAGVNTFQFKASELVVALGGEQPENFAKTYEKAKSADTAAA